MAVKKSYNRYFIIFQEEDKGYGIAIDKQPTGYTKIENRNGKCKITAYAQNLVKEKGPYYCCLVDTTKDPLVMAKLGVVNIDDTGRGETWWEFKEDDIAGTGVPFDRFNVAAVITGQNNVYAPLAGYIGKDKVSWKDRIPYVPRVEEEPVVQEPVNAEEPVVEAEAEELDEEAKKFKEYEENIKTDGDNIGERWKKDNKEAAKEENKENAKGEGKAKDDKKEDNKKENKEEAKEKDSENKKDNLKAAGEKAEEKKDNPDSKDKENKKENTKAAGEKAEEKKDNPKDEAKKASEEKPKDVSKDNPKEEAAVKPENYPGVIEPFNYDEDIEAKEVSGYMDDNFNRKGDEEKRPFATMFHDILEDFDEEDDLTDEFKNARWWKIPLSDELPISENAYYPYYCAIYHLKMTYPYINYIKYIKDTGHYHFGMKYDSAGEVKYILYGIEGNSGSNFQPYMGMTGFIRWIKMKGKDKGMWIMYYNPHTGCIMIPKKR